MIFLKRTFRRRSYEKSVNIFSFYRLFGHLAFIRYFSAAIKQWNTYFRFKKKMARLAICWQIFKLPLRFWASLWSVWRIYPVLQVRWNNHIVSNTYLEIFRMDAERFWSIDSHWNVIYCTHNINKVFKYQ